MKYRTSLVTAFAAIVLGLWVTATLPACSSTGAEGTSASPTTPTPDPGADGDDAGEPDASSDGSTAAACSYATCKGGCCAGGACNKASASACGTSGSACVDCRTSADGHACVGGACGCSSTSDCAAGEVCDPVAGRCGKDCAVQPCTSGCCSPGGVCLAGTDGNACGSSGSCVSCAGLTKGVACVAGGACGCNTAADCASPHQACDITTHTCTSACSPTQPCKSGCCENGSCGGQKATACGGDGLACVDCTENPNGNACSFATKHCGCDSASDCAVGKACDTNTHTCTDKCSLAQLCNGGCCSGTTCAAGDSASACLFGSYAFNQNGMCTACGAAARGTQCLPFGGNLHTCGCTTNAQCGAGRVCQYKGLNGTNECCVPKDGVSATAGACCSGVSFGNICG